MNPFPDDHSVLIMDNCKIHHTNTLQDVLNDAGLYSIMFDRVHMHSIIHPQVSCYFISHHTHLTSTRFRSHLVYVCNTVLLQIFPTILTKLSGKAYLRHHGGMICGADDPILVLLEACGCITAEGWFRHAGYVVAEG